MEEIVTFVRAQREQLADDRAWQNGYDPNDSAALGAIDGEWDMLQKLCSHLGLGDVESV